MDYNRTYDVLERIEAHYNKMSKGHKKIADYIRITIGTDEQMQRLEDELVKILNEKGGALN